MYVTSNIITFKKLLTLLIKVNNLNDSNLIRICETSKSKKLFYKLERINNKELLELAYRHKLIEFLFESKLIKLYLPDFHKKIKEINTKVLQRNLKNIIHTREVIRDLNQNNIRVLTLKGIALSMQTKGSYSSRISSDLDLFISSQDFLKALKVLKNRDYFIKHNFFPNQINKVFINIFLKIFYEITLEKKGESSCNIDLHWKLTNYNSNLPNFEEAYLEKSLIKNPNIKLFSLNKNDSFKYCCAHAAKDKWIFFGNLLDIHFLAKKISRENLKKFLKNKEIKSSLYATYILTNDEHYNFSKNINRFERFYIKKISRKFQNLNLKSIDNIQSNIYIKFLVLFHEFYLTSSFFDVFSLIIRTCWKILPYSFQLRFKNKNL